LRLRQRLTAIVSVKDSKMSKSSSSRRAMLLVLHPAFALTGVGCAITGALLPSLAQTFALTDSQSGLLVFAVYAGMATGALLCRGNYARIIAFGLAAVAATSIGMAFAERPLLFPIAFLYGASVSAPMTATSLFAGRNYPARRAATLTALNFAWSVGAMAGPLFAARVLAPLGWRAVYEFLAGAALLAAIATGLSLRDQEETPHVTAETTGFRNVRLIALFAVFFFLEVGMETTAGAWISTHILRSTATTVALAAAASSIFWGGFLFSRGLAPLVLLRLRPQRMLQATIVVALGASTLLLVCHSAVPLVLAVLLLGLALAPIFPVALAEFFERARLSSDSRFVLALSAFGGAVFPWLVGIISSHTTGLRVGLVIVPATLLVMIAMLPLLAVTRAAPEHEKSPGASTPGDLPI
jgi:MFS transporter, FHS family, glucose/mannose:H+ symporter